MTFFRNALFIVAQLVIFMVILAIPNKASAQISITDRDAQQWIQYVNVITFPHNWSINTNASYRWRDIKGSGFQYHIRSGLGYQLSDQVRFLSGIGYFQTINGNSSIHHEVRPYQGLQFNNDLKRIRMINRFQVEERVLKLNETDQQQPMYLRFRYGLIFNFPLFDLSKNEKRRDLDLVIRNQLFFNGKNNFSERSLDLERVTIGTSFGMDHLSFVLLLHNQITTLPVKGDFMYTRIIAFQVVQRLDL